MPGARTCKNGFSADKMMQRQGGIFCKTFGRKWLWNEKLDNSVYNQIFKNSSTLAIFYAESLFAEYSPLGQELQLAEAGAAAGSGAQQEAGREETQEGEKKE